MRCVFYSERFTQSFRQWLSRYRKSNGVPARLTAEPASTTKQTNSNVELNTEEKKPPSSEWIEPAPFKFTDPSTLKKEDDIILRYL